MDVVVGDLNADGKLDLTVTTSTFRISGYGSNDYGQYPIYTDVGHLKVLLGNGDGSFTSASETKNLGDGRFFSAALGDLDVDGDLDVAMTNWNGGDISVLLGNGDGIIGEQQRWPVGVTAQQIDIADLNADGKLDLVTINLNSNIKVLLGNGDGTFQPAPWVALAVQAPKAKRWVK